MWNPVLWIRSAVKLLEFTVPNQLSPPSILLLTTEVRSYHATHLVDKKKDPYQNLTFSCIVSFCRPVERRWCPKPFISIFYGYVTEIIIRRKYIFPRSGVGCGQVSDSPSSHTTPILYNYTCVCLSYLILTI